MKKILNLLAVIVLTMLPVSGTFAEVIPLLESRSDYLKKDFLLSLKTDAKGKIVSMIYFDGYKDNEYSPEDLADRIVLYRQSKFGVSKDINWISSDRFDAEKGGSITLTVLREYGGIFSFDYRELNLELLNVKGKWTLYLADQNKNFEFNRMFFHSLRDGDEVLGTDEIDFFIGSRLLGKLSTAKMREGN